MAKRVFKPAHEEPGDFSLDYILLPYGEFYEKTKGILEASRGDILRFFNGPEYEIEFVRLIPQDETCDFLCRMRYGIPWVAALKRWASYASLEGNGKDILSRSECILVVYDKNKR